MSWRWVWRKGIGIVDEEVTEVECVGDWLCDDDGAGEISEGSGVKGLTYDLLVSALSVA